MPDETPISELVGLAVDRLDGVGEPASGTPFLLLKSIADPNRRPEPDAYQELITGVKPDGASCNAVTADGRHCKNPPVTGSNRCRHHGGQTVKGSSTMTNPTQALARLQKAAESLPPQHPARLHANALIVFHRLRAAHMAAKSIPALDGEQAYAVDQAAKGVMAAGADPFVVPSQSQRDQIRAIFEGTAESETLANHPGTNVEAVENMQHNSTSGMGFIKEIAEAEHEFALAKSGNDPMALERAGEKLTLLKLQAHHLLKGVIQDGLNGTQEPQAASSLTSMSGRLTPATGGVSDAQGTSPSGRYTGRPGVTTPLQGGESPYGIPGEAMADLTKARADVESAREVFDRAERGSDPNRLDQAAYDLTAKQLVLAHLEGRI